MRRHRNSIKRCARLAKSLASHSLLEKHEWRASTWFSNCSPNLDTILQETLSSIATRKPLASSREWSHAAPAFLGWEAPRAICQGARW